MSINPIQIQKYLKGVDYPCDLDRIMQKAKENHAPEDILDVLSKLKSKQFQRPTDVTKAVSAVK